VPLVAVGSGNQTRVPMVSVANGSGAEAATRHLLDLGHRTVHHLGGPANWLESRDREEGWRRTLEAARFHLRREGDRLRVSTDSPHPWQLRTGGPQGMLHMSPAGTAEAEFRYED
jgi:DNA-binding LacI/PurR family transcriptional regulator